ncbi:MAG: hypothetical protein RIS44_2602 [Pseudomonadota bacterium]|jgi:hypothetical protein
MRNGKTGVLRLKSQTLLACIAVLLTTGCVTPMVETKRVVADSKSYLAESFTLTQLSPTVQAAVTKGSSLSPRFRTMRINFIAETESDGKKQEIAGVRDLNNIGNGYIQTRTEFSRNAIPYRVNLELSFLGLVRLKDQIIYLARTNGEVPFEVKEIKRFDREVANPVKGTTYLFESRYGSSGQLANFYQDTRSCTAGEAFQASSLHSVFSGRAVSLECSLIAESSVAFGKEKWAYLEDYGVAWQIESASSKSTAVMKIVDVSITR